MKNSKQCYYCKKTFKYYLHQYSSLDNVCACKNCGKKERYKLRLERNNEVNCSECFCSHFYPKEILEPPKICDRCIDAKEKQEMEEINEMYRGQDYERNINLFADKLNLTRDELEDLINFINNDNPFEKKESWDSL